MGNKVSNKLIPRQEMSFTPVEEFEFHGPFEDDSPNGLILCARYLPEEVLWKILSYVPFTDLLRLSLVCKKWCNILKSDQFWIYVYNIHYPIRTVQLPWYVYFSYLRHRRNYENLLLNTNGEKGFKHWKIVKNYGDEFQIEDPPAGANELPSHVKDFNGKTSCFATSFYECNKIQAVSLKNKRLLRYIIKKHRPHIYVSEWMAGRFDCGCMYQLGILGYGERYDKEVEFARKSNIQPDTSPITPLFQKTKQEVVAQWRGKAWKKVEILVDKYPEDVLWLVFEHEGRDTQFWKGHYGSKMAGGVLKFVFDSIEPIEAGGSTSLS